MVKMGKIKKRTGKSGNNIIIEVPVGTCIYDSKSGELISDLKYPEQYIVVAAGGKGGEGKCKVCYLYFAST